MARQVRLAVYAFITAMGYVALVGSPVFADQTIGAFRYVENKDPMEDYDRSFIATDSVSGSREAALIWKCLEDGLNAIYLYNKYLSGDRYDQVSVRYRIDGGTASEPASWDSMQGDRAAAIPMAQVNEFTRAAMGGSEIVLQVTDPSDGEKLTDTFRLNGLPQAVQKLSCFR